MTVSETGLDNMQQAVRDVVRHHSGLFLAQEIIMTLLGVAALIWPQISPSYLFEKTMIHVFASDAKSIACMRTVCIWRC